MWRTRKQRTLSGLVVVALILIFAPIFFHSDIKAHLVTFESPPEMPVISTQIKPAPPPELSVPSAIQKATPLPKAWVVKLAGFKEKKQAHQLEQILIKQHFKSFTYRDKGDYTVYIGPVLDQSGANQLQKTAEAALGIHGSVEVYHPMG